VAAVEGIQAQGMRCLDGCLDGGPLSARHCQLFTYCYHQAWQHQRAAAARIIIAMQQPAGNRSRQGGISLPTQPCVAAWP
jgi:hypothetical protein